MGFLDNITNQICEIITTTTNVYGDQVTESSKEWHCRFRESGEIRSGNNREDLAGADAMIHLPADAPAIEGTIIKYDDRYWRVTKVNKGRRFSDEVLFLKCWLETHQEPIEEEIS